ncbi:nuclear transport factor 2 family protein [Kribbella sp. DT2]|uniref:nuclear transport factor 2 family protein n=1 Tax=Kribbella sp. DT2 TaxID=3393427 RepID=UPI003CEAECB4
MHAGDLDGLMADAGVETPAEFTTPGHTIVARDNLAVAWGDRVAADAAEIRSRATRVFQHTPDGWKLIHQHLRSLSSRGSSFGSCRRHPIG